MLRSYMSIVSQQDGAVGPLISQLSTLHDVEVSDEQHSVLDRIYEPKLEVEQWERAGARPVEPVGRLLRCFCSVTPGVELVEAGDLMVCDLAEDPC